MTLGPTLGDVVAHLFPTGRIDLDESSIKALVSSPKLVAVICTQHTHQKVLTIILTTPTSTLNRESPATNTLPPLSSRATEVVSCQSSLSDSTSHCASATW